MYNFGCPCLIDNKPVKVPKGILNIDAEGDMYPDDFCPLPVAPQPDYTEEGCEQNSVTKSVKQPMMTLLQNVDARAIS